MQESNPACSGSSWPRTRLLLHPLPVIGWGSKHPIFGYTPHSDRQSQDKNKGSDRISAPHIMRVVGHGRAGVSILVVSDFTGQTNTPHREQSKPAKYLAVMFSQFARPLNLLFIRLISALEQTTSRSQWTPDKFGLVLVLPKSLSLFFFS